MADPVLTGGIRVLATLQGSSALPEDRFVTTWAFGSDAADSEAAKVAAIGLVRLFYNGSNGGQTRIADSLSGQHLNLSLSTFTAYYLGDPVGFREPYTEEWGGAGFGSGTALPSEVAVCASYYSEFNRPRSRGRVYLGPLVSGAMTSSAGQPARVHPNLMDSITSSMTTLIDFQPILGPRWCVIAKSETTSAPELKPITHGWCDNAFDTMRKRGEKATARGLT
jgi:hypothetical protein